MCSETTTAVDIYLCNSASSKSDIYALESLVRLSLIHSPGEMNIFEITVLKRDSFSPRDGQRVSDI